MSVEAAHGADVVHGHGEHAHEEHLAHQFEDRGQQDESYIVGMWSFLVTEVLFFGALFLAYSLFRLLQPEIFQEGHKELSVGVGAFNTWVLLTSSLTMALAVWAAQTGKRWLTIGLMSVTTVLAGAFLVVKLLLEWIPKYQHHLVPGPNFQFHSDTLQDTSRMQLFFGLYFAMTGLHAIHVIVGMLIMGVLIGMLVINHPSVRYYMPIELYGLYWHFVDIVWIFLYPLFYLIGN